MGLLVTVAFVKAVACCPDAPVCARQLEWPEGRPGGPSSAAIPWDPLATPCMGATADKAGGSGAGLETSISGCLWMVAVIGVLAALAAAAAGYRALS